MSKPVDTIESMVRMYSDVQHVLELPDNVIGSVQAHKEIRWVWDAQRKCIVRKSVQYCPGFYKIVDEILVNALDHVVRQRERIAKNPEAGHLPVKNIYVTLDKTSFGVKNDGDGIPVAIHKEHNMWVPDMLFGNLRTSTNYNKQEEKIVGGKNGLGAKAANIFARKFVLETVDAQAGKKCVIEYSDNMSKRSTPHVTSCKNKPYTSVQCTPDLTRFRFSSDSAEASCTEIPDDMLAILFMRVMSIAACAGPDVKVHVNDELVPCNSLAKFMLLFADPTRTAKITQVVHEQCNERWEVGALLISQLVDSPGLVFDIDKEKDADADEAVNSESMFVCSFVNGIYTQRGGRHVDMVSRQLLSGFCQWAGKQTKAKVTPSQVKRGYMLFVKSTIVNPAFDAQTKDTLTTPAKEFGSSCTISEKFIEKLGKSGLLDIAKMALSSQELKEAKKTDGNAKRANIFVPKLEDAEWAGTSKSDQCTLILTEGDSAHALAVAGLSVVGRQKYGVFPLRGKLLNVRGLAEDVINNNAEIGHIKEILGLRHAHVYKTLSELRYGHLMIMSDQDTDGDHIAGLIINLIHAQWPSLIELGFIKRMHTPLVKATKGTEIREFYAMSDYIAWRETDEAARGSWAVKYYKGLATSTTQEAKRYFKALRTVTFAKDEGADEAIVMAFDKAYADERKTWLEAWDPDDVLDFGKSEIGIHEFVNKCLIHFGRASIIRSIGHIGDGLKPSQRKILFACLKRNLKTDVKVAQLQGYISENTAYHHGDASLNQTIISMARNYTGSNNINCLVPSGQFGSRLTGSCASGARYIYTHLEPITRALYPEEDDACLDYLEDDGIAIEPAYYIPILPMHLVNGLNGRGMGYSSNILPHNPTDLIAALRTRLRHDMAGVTDKAEWPALTPYWHGWTGRIVAAGTTWYTFGKYEWDADNRLHITELPIEAWTLPYKEEVLLPLFNSDGKTSPILTGGIVDQGTESTVHLVLTVHQDHLARLRASVPTLGDKKIKKRVATSEVEDVFKLTSSFSTANMWLWDCDMKLQCFDTAADVLDAYYPLRLEHYRKRRLAMMAAMQKELIELRARKAFVSAIVDKERPLRVFREPDEVVVERIRALGVPPLSHPDRPEAIEAYNYLMHMRIDRFTMAQVDKLHAEITNKEAWYKELEEKDVRQWWLEELDHLESMYGTYMAEREQYWSMLDSESADSTDVKASKTKVKVSKTKAKAKVKAKA